MGRRPSRGPFERLGTLKQARPAEKTPAAPGDPKAPHQSSPVAESDDPALFRDAVRDVQPLQAPPRVERPDASAAPRRARPAPDGPPLPHPPGVVPTIAEFDEDSHAKHGVGPDVLRKLRRLEWPVEAELSVRGMTQAEAWDALQTFLSECAAHGMRCVRVIHGKGMQSPGRMPVLKGRVRAWLAQEAGVRAFAEAPPAAGGSGALIVLLRARKAP